MARGVAGGPIRCPGALVNSGHFEKKSSSRSDGMGGLSLARVTMASARSNASRARITQSLTPEQIAHELFSEGEESVFDDSDNDEDYTQLSGDSSSSSESENDRHAMARPIRSPMPPRPFSTPILPRPHSSCGYFLFEGDELEGGDSFSGFSDSDQSFIEPVAGTSGVTGREIVASAASRPAKRHRMAPNAPTSRAPTSRARSRRASRRRYSAPGRRYASLPRRLSSASRRTPGVLEWSDGDDFIPNIPHFDDKDVGITNLFPNQGEDMAEMEYFTAFYDEPLMEYIVHQTNLHAAYLIEREITEFSRLQRWKNTTVAEMYVFLALCLLMKHCHKHAINDYWSKDKTIPTPLFGKYMSRDRFQILLRCLHFGSVQDRTPDDRLWRVRHYMNDVIGKFRDFYVPAQKLVVDESLILFKGRVPFKQYIPSKRNRFGLKFFVLCDCETGYVLHMILYSASDVDIPGNDEHGFSGSVVKTIMAPWMNKGHILYTDNYYTSPLLARFLLENRTGLVGTVKPQRREMPVFDNDIAVGECQRRKSDNILSVRWKDKREVNLLTTIHDGTMVNSGKVSHKTNAPLYKPDCVLDYNINMRLIDKSDMMIGTAECVRKTCRWTKKVFFHLVDMSMLNCFNMYLVRTGRKPTFRDFVFDAAIQLLGKFAKDVPGIQRPIINPLLQHAGTPRLAHTEGFLAHKLKYLPPGVKRAIAQRDCLVCKTTTRRDKKRKLVQTWCETCGIPLCAVDCFNDYHSLEIF